DEPECRTPSAGLLGSWGPGLAVPEGCSLHARANARGEAGRPPLLTGRQPAAGTDAAAARALPGIERRSQLGEPGTPQSPRRRSGLFPRLSSRLSFGLPHGISRDADRVSAARSGDVLGRRAGLLAELPEG